MRGVSATGSLQAEDNYFRHSITEEELRMEEEGGL